MKTHTSTRDNFVAHAIQHGSCPSTACKRPLERKSTGVISCPCGFYVGRPELETFRKAGKDGPC